MILSPGGGNVGIGFAISSDLARPVLEQLQRYGQTRRGWLGVRIQEVTEEIAEALGLSDDKGALIVAVNEREPAQTAGLKVGDVILRFGGKRIDSVRQLRRAVADTAINKSVRVEVWRGDEIKTFNVTIGNLEGLRTGPGHKPAAAEDGAGRHGGYPRAHRFETPAAQ